jgi:hypothetical protein
MSAEFTPREKILINSLVDPAHACRFATTIWPYLFWVLLSVLFLFLYFGGRDGNPGLLISAYCALLLPNLIGMITIRGRCLALSNVIRKYEEKLGQKNEGSGEHRKIS